MSAMWHRLGAVLVLALALGPAGAAAEEAPVEAEAKAEADVPFSAGCELYVKRSAAGIEYHHAGVYIGDGKVVHVSAEPLGALKDLWDGKPMVNVILSTYAEFAAGDEVTKGPTEPKFKPEEIVARAKAKVGQPWTYDAEGNNCQHFSSERVGGTALSPEAAQMRQAMTAVQEELETKAANLADEVKGKADEVTDQAKSKADDVTKKVKGLFE